MCQGKRAAIIGGKIQAAEEINAKQIGSVTGNVETVCEVGYDPQKKHKLESLAVKKTELQAEFDEVQLNLQTLVNIKKQRGSLPEDKEAYMKELNEKRQTLAQEITEANTLYQQLEEELKSLQSMGSVSASAKIFPGVVVCIRDQKEIIRAEHKAVTFVLEGDMIRSSAYVETKAEDLKKKTPGKK